MAAEKVHEPLRPLRQIALSGNEGYRVRLTFEHGAIAGAVEFLDHRCTVERAAEDEATRLALRRAYAKEVTVAGHDASGIRCVAHWTRTLDERLAPKVRAEGAHALQTSKHSEVMLR
jgi:hypothetical protein